MFEGSNEPRGIGGWLGLLCFGLAIGSPLLTLVNLAAGWSDSAKLIGVVPGWFGFFVTDTVLSLAVALLCVWAGVALWRTRPGAPRAATIALCAVIGYHVASAIEVSIFPLPANVKEAVQEELMPSATRGTLFAMIWIAYLHRSKRVRNTFGAESTAA